MVQTQRNSNAWLVPALALVAGLAAGWATSPFRGAQARGPERTERQAAAPQARLEGSDSLRGLGVEAAPVQARTEVQGAAPLVDEEQPAAPVGELAPSHLSAELTALLRSGRIELALARDPPQMLRFTVQAYLTMKSPSEALALMHRHPTLDAAMWQRVAYAFLSSDDKASAALAFQGQLEHGEWDLGALAMLSSLDPQAGIALLEAQLPEFDEYARLEHAATHANLLAATGRQEEAAALLRDLMAQGELSAESLAALKHFTLEDSERLLREALEFDNNGAASVALAQLLASGERGEEGSALLRDLLARQPENNAAVAALLALDPAAALAHLPTNGNDLSPELWSQAGAALMSQGRASEAVDAWLRGFEASPDNGDVIAALAQHAPERLWAECQRMSADTRDDELLGDIADVYWGQGRREDAVDLWRRASRIDPGDGEWSGKLRSVAQGRDPIGG